ncbi:unnamed protein product, partial [marine sediment metagenome]
LNKLNIINKEFLKKQRKIVYVLIFLLAALITPPDAITLLMLSLPLVFLYEIIFIILKIV